ncbi:MAG: CBS domain-containing protein [Steroidobacteraceae bacterium]
MNPSYRLQSGAAVTVAHSLRSAPGHHLVRRSDSAVRVMTDFAASPAFTIGAECAIDDALDEMFRRGVRALIVLGEDNAVVGLVTSYDIQGERTQQHLEGRFSRRSEQVRVRDILTPCREWSSLDWHRVESARIEDVLELFRSTDSPYLVVLETGNGTAAGFLRGIISRTRLERQLGESP